jgi:hypothetical protein
MQKKRDETAEISDEEAEQAVTALVASAETRQAIRIIRGEISHSAMDPPELAIMSTEERRCRAYADLRQVLEWYDKATPLQKPYFEPIMPMIKEIVANNPDRSSSSSRGPDGISRLLELAGISQSTGSRRGIA